MQPANTYLLHTKCTESAFLGVILRSVESIFCMCCSPGFTFSTNFLNGIFSFDRFFVYKVPVMGLQNA